MTTTEKIRGVNTVLQAYFNVHPNSAPVPAKDFMSRFIQAGIFPSDHRSGLPVRKLLRTLDDDRQLHLIPFVIAERKSANTNWFFGPARLNQITTADKPVGPKTSGTKARQAAAKPRSLSDECYVLDLCDEVLGMRSVRQHRFPFLVGDPGLNGRCAPLPVDGWYESLNLVIEFNERQHTEAVPHFDKRMTVSGVNRGQQRALYDKRKREVLPAHGIQVVTFAYNDFGHNRQKKLMRDLEADREVIRTKLKHYL